MINSKRSILVEREQGILLCIVVIFFLITSCDLKDNTDILNKKVVILTFGDSITQGVREKVNVSQTFTYYLGKLLEKDGVDVEMIRQGISGEKTNDALRRLNRDVIARSPHFVTIMYGTNDAYIDVYHNIEDTTPRIPIEEYKENLLAIIQKLRGKKINPILMTPIPMGNFWSSQMGIYAKNDINFKLREYVEVVRQMAKEKKVPLVDHFKEWMIWKERGKDINQWMTDGVHPNPKGHRLIAQSIFKVIRKELEQ